MKIHIPRVSICITLNTLIMEMYMSREGWIPLTGLTNDSYMSRKD